MWKTNGLYVMLGTKWTWTARTLDVFLELKPRSIPPAVLSYDSPSRPSCFLWEDLFSFFCILFSRRLLKDKPELRKGSMTDYHYFSAFPLLTTTHTVWKKRVLCEIGHREAKRGLLLEKVAERVRSDGIVQGLFLSRASLHSKLTSVYMSRGGECSDTDLDVHARCFLSASYCLSQLSFPWCSALMSEDRRESVDLREYGDSV